MRSIFLAVLLTFVSFAAPAQQAAPAQPLRAQQILEAEVVAPNGRVIGAVRDLVVDTKEARVAYVVLAVGSIVGVTDFLAAFPLPTEGLTLGAGRVTLATTRQAVEALGGFSGSQWPDFNKPAEGAAAPAEIRYQRATELAKAGILDRRGSRVGEVEDLLVNPADGKLAAIVIKFIPAWHDPASLVAVPPASLGRKGAAYVANFEASDMRPATASSSPPPAAAKPAAAPKGPEGTDVRLTKLIGTTVVDHEGKTIGEVRDLAIDAKTYQVTQIHVAAADRVMAVPTAGRAIRVLDGKVMLDADAAKSPPPTEPAPGTILASKLLKAPIVDTPGKEVGSLEDVVVGVERARVRYGIAQFTPNWVQEGKMVALPLRETQAAGAGRVSMRFDLNELNSTYFFDRASFPEVNAAPFRETIDRYFPPR